MKKICFIATAQFAVEAFLLNHFRKLVNEYEITVIVDTLDSSFLEKHGLSLRVFPVNISRNISLLSDFLALIKIIIFLKKNKFDAVHTITPKAGLLGMLAAKLLMVPLRVHTFTGQVWVNKGRFVRQLLKFIDWFIANISTFNIVDSPSQRDFLIKEKVVTKNKSIVFAKGSVSGVDLKKFKPDSKVRANVRSSLKIPKSAFVYIYIGRITQDKGLLDLASAFSKLKPGEAFLVFVGPDEGGLIDKIKNVCASHNDYVRFVDYTLFPQMYLAGADVLCLPSYREGFGNVIIEAAAIGLPAVASKIYGISDAVQNHKTGLLHARGNINSIATCLKFFLENREFVKVYGLAAQKRAVNEFDANILSKHWFDFYLKHLP